MKVTLNHRDYLDLLGHVGELQGLVGGLLTYSCIPEDVKVLGKGRLTTIREQVDTLLNSPKDYLP